MSERKRTITFTPAFDKRDPDPKKNYGIGSVHIFFRLQGPEGIVQLRLGTNWDPKHVQREFRNKPESYFNVQPRAWDLGYHSPTPRYEGQPFFDCALMPGGKCYYDGSTLSAEPIRDRFLEEGEDAVWEELERFYAKTFGVAHEVSA